MPKRGPSKKRPLLVQEAGCIAPRSVSSGNPSPQQSDLPPSLAPGELLFECESFYLAQREGKFVLHAVGPSQSLATIAARKYLTPADAAVMLGCSDRTFRKLMSHPANPIPCERVTPHTPRFTEEDIRQWAGEGASLAARRAREKLKFPGRPARPRAASSSIYADLIIECESVRSELRNGRIVVHVLGAVGTTEGLPCRNYLTTAQVAELLQVGPGTMRAMMDHPKRPIPHIRLSPSAPRFVEDEIRRWIAEGGTTGNPRRKTRSVTLLSPSEKARILFGGLNRHPIT